MAYAHLSNLYKTQTILLFRECWALEKVHGTSAHVGFKDGKVSYYSGGASAEAFRKLFNEADLLARFTALGHTSLIVYGEAHGGKEQGMRDTYGPALRFIVFDVFHPRADGGGEEKGSWLDVPDAVDVAEKLGLEFVPYARVATDLTTLDRVRDEPSRVAERRGITTPMQSEGVVLRPIHEMYDKRGNRVIAKHKTDNFRETATTRKVVDPAQMAIMEKAEAIATEWATDMRLRHVLDKLGNVQIADTPRVIEAMLADILREGEGEIVDSKDARRAIGHRTVKLFHALVKKVPT